ncbi:carbohydrate ABC transporter permease [Paenibacillus sp. GCM10023248]|uniref:carbohydrate ABC transporter permease n=1 Tax=unclassified Paenibacillus TaxID=185978 RepID=UPI0023780FB4|nr:sugar ABC transporter permease [Paenibacillus sp. MAHUQ-63]MDD9266296.1 sugar ABC transporter permease [Paenibacillus sp. MAHUQ-63]
MRVKGISELAKDRLFLLVLIVPALAMLLFTIGIPIVKSIYMSFFKVTLLSMKNQPWNDFANYAEIFKDGEFFEALRVTLTYVVCIVSVQFVLGMCLALLLNANIRFKKLFRTLILIPWIVPTIVSALLWMWLFQPQYGLINYVLQQLHLISKPQDWLTNLDLALPAVIVTALWRQLPFMSTMLLAGMQGISEDMYEAARIDGANRRQLLLYITLPMLKNNIKTITLISIIENFKMFPLFWIMTGGGPLNTTTTLAIYSYKAAFVQLNLGKGAAIGAVWLIIMLLISMLYNKLFSLGEEPAAGRRNSYAKSKPVKQKHAA